MNQNHIKSKVSLAPKSQDDLWTLKQKSQMNSGLLA